MPAFLTDRIRAGLSPGARRQLRRFADRFFSSLGSVNGAILPTKSVALTIDDGPDPAVTPRLLDVLARRGVRATFFVLTDKAGLAPGLVRRAVAEGHESALHFDRHDRLTSLPVKGARDGLVAARARLEDLAGPVEFFRPPFGGQSLATFFLARSLGLQVVSWGPHAEDWVEQPPALAASRALEGLGGGEILLLHDGLEMAEGEQAPTFDRVRMVELILDGMAQRGLAPTTVGGLIRDAKPRLSPWFRY